MNYTSFLLQNPWRKGNFPQDTSIKRDIFVDFLKDIDNNEITVVTGSRQVGKTTLLKSVISKLLQSEVVPSAIFYFNLDDENLHSYFNNYSDFIDFIHSEHTGFSYIFIDEAQRLKNPGLFLKLLYDLKLDMKIVVSGSSSLELKAKTSEHLTGRKHSFELYPFCFEEFLSLKKVDFYFKKSVDSLIKFHGSALNTLLAEFITYGGYPKPLLAETAELRIIELKETYDSYIKKDVKDFLKIDNISGYNNLIKALAHQIGNLINYNELSLTSGLNIATVRKYIDYLEGTYIFKRISPSFSNARKEISKSPKIYGHDTGLMNYITNSIHQGIENRGNTIENFVFSEMIKKGLEVKFWRTGSGSEIDFVVNSIPVEVKFSFLKKTTLPKSYFSYCNKYQPDFGLLLNPNLRTERKINEKPVYFFPLWAVPKVLDWLMVKDWKGGLAEI